MNKLILAATTAASLALSAGAFASEGGDYKAMNKATMSAPKGGYFTVGVNLARKINKFDHVRGLTDKADNTTFGNVLAQESKNNKPEIMLGIGSHLDNGLRADLTFNWGNNLDHSAVAVAAGAGANDPSAQAAYTLKSSTMTLMGNGYYHFMENESVSPYVTAGVGVARHKTTLTSAALTQKDTKTTLAWQAGVGVSGNVAEGVDWDLGYRYADKGKFSELAVGPTAAPFDDTSVAVNNIKRVKTHAVMLSMRVGF